MTMAALNILSQPWPPLSFSNNNISYLTKCISNTKLLSLSHSYHFSVLSSLYGTNRPNSSSKLSSMPTHLSKSGNFSVSWSLPFCIYFLFLTAHCEIDSCYISLPYGKDCEFFHEKKKWDICLEKFLSWFIIGLSTGFV